MNIIVDLLFCYNHDLVIKSAKELVELPKWSTAYAIEEYKRPLEKNEKINI